MKIQEVDVSIATSVIIVSINFTSNDPINNLYISYVIFTDIDSPVAVFEVVDPIQS
jgi:hypothetical protein